MRSRADKVIAIYAVHLVRKALDAMR